MIKMEKELQMEKINLQLGRTKRILKMHKKINKQAMTQKRKMLINQIKLFKTNLLNILSGRMSIINQEFLSHSINLSNKSKIKFLLSNEKMLKSS
jgi:hypothetical protein